LALVHGPFFRVNCNPDLIELETMASQPILDLASINLNDVAVSKEEILAVNAQRDEFEQLDRLITLDLEQGLAVGIKTQTPGEFWTRGHIPGRPIMPGVLMIEMAAQVSSVIYHLKFNTAGTKFFGFGGVSNVKFRGSVEPGSDLIMVVRAKALRSRMAVFEAQGFVDGKMVFEGEVTGLVL
jgi:3-hydroxyacyl-[acyl-carrier-protein] dehydratase